MMSGSFSKYFFRQLLFWLSIYVIHGFMCQVLMSKAFCTSIHPVFLLPFPSSFILHLLPFLLLSLCVCLSFFWITRGPCQESIPDSSLLSSLLTVPLVIIVQASTWSKCQCEQSASGEMGERCFPGPTHPWDTDLIGQSRGSASEF